MDMTPILNLITQGKVKSANYLPIEQVDFVMVFDLAIANNEITYLVINETSDGKKIILGYVMDDTLYQSNNPNFHLPKLIPELNKH
ncbi:hypothetical protein OTK49_21570 [Vibrio coralliirubri]|uniref:hypothetical protein n=1 Tax=Vibrio coralliirubri TaxID=1516159 RepID=UPI0022853822|nr:hypothetical protein [Vibrio coralliirubri]MCY9865112.1 hypothetical protein [Vibrio coralliirubri]